VNPPLPEFMDRTDPSKTPHLGLARKHRPQGFEEIIGQEAVSTTLRNAVADKKPSHAYLFFGPRGVGKTTTARVLAKALNCEKGPTPDPCGKCDSCREIARSAAIDVLELDAATNTQVDRIREMILETVSLAPSRDRYKVFIIDEVHMLSAASFNALLKTLEEPPLHVVFILATTDPGKVPATVVSRCQRFRFRPLPLEAMVKHLHKLAKTEGIEAEPAALELLARAAGGSVRDAVGLLEQAGAYADGKVTAEGVRELLGSLPEEHLTAIARALLERDAAAMAKALDKTFEEGAEPAQILRDLRERLHAAHMHRLGTAPPWDEAWRLLAEPRSPEALGYLVRRINKLLESLRLSDAPRLSLEAGLYGMLEGSYDVDQWMRRLDILERRLASGIAAEPPAPEAAPEPAPAAAPARESEASAEDVWPSVLKQVRAHKPGLAEDLRSARLVLGDGAQCGLIFQRTFELERARNNQGLLEESLAGVLGRPVSLKFDIGPAPAPKAAQAGPPPAGPEESAGEEGGSAEDPAVKTVLEVFPGRVRHIKKKP